MSPAVSESQRKKMCIALDIKLGKKPKNYSPEASKMAKEMSLKQLSEYCHGKVKE